VKQLLLSLSDACFPMCQAGVMNYILHPGEPLAIRVSLIKAF
jgi:hypothetical protein